MALVELDGFGEFVELEKIASEFFEKVSGFGRRGVEELAAEVHSVNAAVRQPGVHLVLDVDCVVREEQRMYVEAERGGAAGLAGPTGTAGAPGLGRP